MLVVWLMGMKMQGMEASGLVHGDEDEDAG